MYFYLQYYLTITTKIGIKLGNLIASYYSYVLRFLFSQAAREKQRKRRELLKEIEKVGEVKLQEALKDEELKEADLHYSTVKRAYARRIKQRIIDKMHGKKTVVSTPRRVKHKENNTTPNLKQVKN